jgi:hypothetical protein
MHSAFGNSFLYGLEALAWEEKYDYDLLAIPRPYGENDKDALSQLFLGPLVEVFHNVIGRFYKVSHSASLCLQLHEAFLLCRLRITRPIEGRLNVM